MIRFRYVLFLLCVLLSGSSMAKDKEHTLTGKIKIRDGDTYPYQLVFTASHNNIKGYSITRLPDGSESRTSLTGAINKEKKILIFTEVKMLSELPKDVSACYVNGVLAWKKKAGNYVFSGMFAGKNGTEQCGSGTIEFTQPVAADDLYAPDTIPVVQKPAPLAEKPVPKTGKDQITAGVQRQYDWHTDSCVLEVWDGGVIDGDVITLLVNDEQVLTRYTLAKERKVLKFPITKKINTITVIAEEEGINPPNTVQLIFHDGAAQYKLTAFNKKGERAIVVIRK